MLTDLTMGRNLHLYEIIVAAAQADLFTIGNLAAPVRNGMDIGEMIVMDMAALTELTVDDDGRGIDGINACLVECYGVKAREHSYIRDNSGIVFCMTVTVR